MVAGHAVSAPNVPEFRSIFKTERYEKLQIKLKNAATQAKDRCEELQQSVQQYLSGRALPSLDTFANLCEILELDPAYILCLKK